MVTSMVYGLAFGILVGVLIGYLKIRIQHYGPQNNVERFIISDRFNYLLLVLVIVSFVIKLVS